MLNYYDVLGIEDFSSPEDIKRAYRSMVRKYHPDTTMFDKSFAEGKIREVNEAYSVLGDKDKKVQYDRQLKAYYDQLNNQRFEQENQNKEAHGETGIFCPNCGKKNDPSSKFCCYCGASLITYPGGGKFEHTEERNEERHEFKQEKNTAANKNRGNTIDEDDDREKNHGCLWVAILMCLIIGGVMYSGDKSGKTIVQTNIKLESINSANDHSAKISSAFEKAEEFRMGKKYAFALPFYTNSIDQGIRVVDCYERRGICYMCMKEYPKAKDDFTSAIASGCDDTRLNVMRGFSSLFMDDFANAIDDFKHVLVNNSNNFNKASAYEGCGLAYVCLGEHRKALDCFKKAKDLFLKEKEFEGVLRMEEYISKARENIRRNK